MAGAEPRCMVLVWGFQNMAELVSSINRERDVSNAAPAPPPEAELLETALPVPEAEAGHGPAPRGSVVDLPPPPVPPEDGEDSDEDRPVHKPSPLALGAFFLLVVCRFCL